MWEFEDISAESYDFGVNRDRFEVWRNSGDIGYIQLAFNVITEAIYDLVSGDYDNYMSALMFFFGGKEESNYWLFAQVLGYPEDYLPKIVADYAESKHIKQGDVEDIRNLCTTMKSI